MIANVACCKRNLYADCKRKMPIGCLLNYDRATLRHLPPKDNTSISFSFRGDIIRSTTAYLTWLAPNVSKRKARATTMSMLYTSSKQPLSNRMVCRVLYSFNAPPLYIALTAARKVGAIIPNKSVSSVSRIQISSEYGRNTLPYSSIVIVSLFMADRLLYR